MRRRWYLLALLLLAPTSPAAAGPARAATRAPVAEEELDLVVGENRTLSAEGVRNFSEGAAGVAEVKLTTDRTKFVIVGHQPGTTTLLLIHGDGRQTSYRINVFRRAPELVEREVRELLTSLPGLRLERVGTRLFIEGTVATPAECQRVERIAALYPEQVESLVVEGAPPVEKRLNIRVDFFFVEYDALSGYGVGVDWPGRIGGEVIHTDITYDLLRRTPVSATASVIDQPLPALDLAAQRGWAKVLQHSVVITSNGAEASYRSGGEQNFTVAAAQTAAIQPIEFGTRVVVLPRLSPESGDLDVEVKADVAHLIPPLLGSGLPGRSTAELETTVRMKLGQSIVLSGLRSRAERHQRRGLPLLSDIPLLGVFFGSQHHQAEDVQNALFVIPTAVEVVAQPAAELVQEALEEFAEFDGDLAELSSRPHPPRAWQEVTPAREGSSVLSPEAARGR